MGIGQESSVSLGAEVHGHITYCIVALAVSAVWIWVVQSVTNQITSDLFRVIENSVMPAVRSIIGKKTLKDKKPELCKKF